MKRRSLIRWQKRVAAPPIRSALSEGAPATFPRWQIGMECARYLSDLAEACNQILKDFVEVKPEIAQPVTARPRSFASLVSGKERLREAASAYAVRLAEQVTRGECRGGCGTGLCPAPAPPGCPPALRSSRYIPAHANGSHSRHL